MKFLKCSVLLAALVLAPLAAKADQMDTFTAVGGGNTFSFSLPASPTSVGLFPAAFYIDNVAVDFNGTTNALRVIFYDPSDGGGLNLEYNGSSTVFDNIQLFGAQLFTGSLSAPTFQTGTFDLASGGPDGPHYYLTITPSAVPEPSSLMLLGTGLMGVCGLVRRRIVKA